MLDVILFYFGPIEQGKKELRLHEAAFWDLIDVLPFILAVRVEFELFAGFEVP